jgi:DNA-binding IclR family transcriptional regulator
VSRSLSRALSILNLYDGRRADWGISEISRELDLSKSTVHGLISTLESNRYLEKSDNGKYRLGMKVYELGLAYQANAHLGTVAEPLIKALTAKYKQSVHVAIYAGKTAVFVISSNAGNSHVIFPRIGTGMSAYCTGVGKVLLAWQPENHIEEYLQYENLLPYTNNTITDPQKLREELKQVKKRGFAVDREEAVMGICCIAAPIFGSANEIIAALSVSGEVKLILDDKFEDCILDVKHAAQTISIGMGYRV